MSIELSLIVSNHNYARFLPDCLGSAMRQNRHNTELIVVDDGSTDGSLSLLEEYRQDWRIIHQENRGQLAACERGFASSLGTWIWFLDADDQLLPGAFDVARAFFKPGLSKISFPMTGIDEKGAPTRTRREHHGPFVEDSPHAIQALWEIGDYPSPPTSGNVYARSFLEQVFPAPPKWTTAHRPVDLYLQIQAPFHGELACGMQATTAYRIHSSNYGQRIGAQLSASKLSYKCACIELQQNLLEKMAATVGHRLPHRLAFERYDVVRCLITLRKCFPETYPWPDDHWTALPRMAFAAFRRQTHFTFGQRLLRLSVLAFLWLLPGFLHPWIQRIESPLSQRLGR